MQKDHPDNSSEFAKLLQSANRELFGFIFAMLQNRADAEDVYQQTALILWKKFSEFTPGTNFIGWAIRIAQFEIKAFVKTHQRHKVLFSDQILNAIAMTYHPETSHGRDLRLEALARCLEKLSDRDREMVKQCYAVDRDYRNIAMAEGKTITAIYQAISRIRKALYRCIQRSLATD